MKTYLDLLRHVLEKGKPSADRTGVGTRKVFGAQIRVPMSEGFPLLTTKAIHYKSCIHELIWMLSGSTNIKYLQDNGVTIWNEWATPEGELGPVYGFQWRHWPLVNAGIVGWKDQIDVLIKQIKRNPDDRRLLVSAWNVGQLHEMRLPPCHFAFQCQVINGELNLHVFMRSLDIFLGAPFDIALYSFLLHVIARICDLVPGELLISATDVHLYNNHVEQANLQLSREPKKLPTLFLNLDLTDINKLKYDDFTIDGYTPEPRIPAPVAV